MRALQVTAAIVTCGGLCPGLNDVVQNIVYTLNDYGVPEDQVQCFSSSVDPCALFMSIWSSALVLLTAGQRCVTPETLGYVPLHSCTGRPLENFLDPMAA